MPAFRLRNARCVSVVWRTGLCGVGVPHSSPGKRASPLMSARICLLLIALAPALRAQDAERGRELGDAQLAPYFASGPLKQAAAEVQAGRGAAALRLVPERPKDTATK